MKSYKKWARWRTSKLCDKKGVSTHISQFDGKLLPYSKLSEDTRFDPKNI